MKICDVCFQPPLLPRVGDVPRSSFQFDFGLERKVLAEAEKDNPDWSKFGSDHPPPPPPPANFSQPPPANFAQPPPAHSMVRKAHLSVLLSGFALWQSFLRVRRAEVVVSMSVLIVDHHYL